MCNGCCNPPHRSPFFIPSSSSFFLDSVMILPNVCTHTMYLKFKSLHPMVHSFWLVTKKHFFDIQMKKKKLILNVSKFENVRANNWTILGHVVHSEGTSCVMYVCVREQFFFFKILIKCYVYPSVYILAYISIVWMGDACFVCKYQNVIDSWPQVWAIKNK